MYNDRRIIIELPGNWTNDQHKRFTAEFSKFLKILYVSWPGVKVIEKDEMILKEGQI